MEDVDKVGHKISTKGGAAYDLWLQRNIKNATLYTSKTVEDSVEMFSTQNMEALAGLRPFLQKFINPENGIILDG